VKKWDNPYFVQIYVDRLRSIYFNLKNPELLGQITSGQMKAHTIAFMTHQEMNPDRWRELIRNKMVRDASKYVTNIFHTIHFVLDSLSFYTQ
jgi:hypothetical protein